MPLINDGSAISSLSGPYSQWSSPYPKVLARSYVAYATLTPTPQLQIPLFVPSRDRVRPDIALTIPAETIYSVRSYWYVGSTMVASGSAKLANVLGDTGFILTSATAGGVITPGAKAGLIGLPGSTLTAPLGTNATPNLPLSIFAVVGATPLVAAGTGLAYSATSVNADDTALRAWYTDTTRLYRVIVEIDTFALEPLSTFNAANLGNADFIAQRLSKGQ